MSDFHITFKKTTVDKYSTGVNIEADQRAQDGYDVAL